MAGKRKGSEDDRWLWPVTVDVVRAVRPRFVVLENVPGLIGLKPHGLDWVCGELEAAGYQCLPILVGADDVGAPHRRKRVWIVGRLADAEDADCDEDGNCPDCGIDYAECPCIGPTEDDCEYEFRDGVMFGRRVAYAEGEGLEGAEPEGDTPAAGCPAEHGGDTADGQAQQRLGRGTSGLPGGLDGRWPSLPGQTQYPWEPPRTTTERVPNRAARLKALGNAIVPQVAYHVINALLDTDR